MRNTGTSLHLERVRAGTTDRLSLSQIPLWITKNTTIQGRPYSFKNHEYQERILSDTSQEIVVRKCSQVGLTEATIRYALALCAMLPYFTLIMTLPSAGLATKIMKTRVDPVVADSDYLKALINTTTDNSEVKHFGAGSFLYLGGAQAGNQAISTPADMLIHDEISFSDREIVERYHSRLSHSKYKRKIKLSTPTHEKDLINEAFGTSRRHFNFVKCNHCNHFFIPDYFDHLKIPGLTVDLKEITKLNIHKWDTSKAYIECPKCGKEPSLQPEHRHWVWENTDEHHNAVGYQVSPFDAPNVISNRDLVKASTEYSLAEFMNFNLGLPAEDKNSTISVSDLHIIPREQISNAGFVMGLDMGLTCWFTILALMPTGQHIVYHVESCPLQDVVERKKQLGLKFRTRMCVVDILPYTETVMRMQSTDPNCFAGVYVNNNSIETHLVVDKDGDYTKGSSDIRKVNIMRNAAFDDLMNDLRAGITVKMADEHDETWRSHLMDMKRVQEYTRDNELKFAWRKSSSHAQDHLHHSLLYASIAAKMIGVATSYVSLPSLVTTFKVKARL